MYISPSQKCEENVEENSLWITATPSPAALSLPFFIVEAGHFFARKEYELKRESHNSFLLLYTIKGEGTVFSGDTNLKLLPGNCAIIDCHIPHEYNSASKGWDFLWIHFNGSGVAPLFEILYPTVPQEIKLIDATAFEALLSKVISLTQNNDIISCTEASAHIHTAFHILLQSMLATEHDQKKDVYSEYIAKAVNFIQENFNQPITIDDMICDIPISKYHFIRLFRRIMSVTPYNYLTNYRINRSKILLHSTRQSIAEIAEACGFLDTSNFIAQFKKHTGVRPTHYRRDFSDI